jgi:hypothetical protein
MPIKNILYITTFNDGTPRLHVTESLEKVRECCKVWLRENKNAFMPLSRIASIQGKRGVWLRDDKNVGFVGKFEITLPSTTVFAKTDESGMYTKLKTLTIGFSEPKLENAEDLEQQFQSTPTGIGSLRTFLRLSCEDIFLGKIFFDFPITFVPDTEKPFLCDYYGYVYNKSFKSIVYKDQNGTLSFENSLMNSFVGDSKEEITRLVFKRYGEEGIL